LIWVVVRPPTKRYPENTDQYIGVDWGKSFHNQSNVDVLANLVQPLPFEDEFADAVVSFQVLEHLSGPLHFLEECHRVLQPQGTIFITVPFMWHVHEAPYDYFPYTRYGLEYLFKKSGFIDVQICENTGGWQILILNFDLLRHVARVVAQSILDPNLVDGTDGNTHSR
jgi:SAM-dependent methyltransferase